MKICLVTEYFYPEDTGGTPTVLSQLMRHLKDTYADLEIDVVTSNNLYRRAGGKLAAYEDWQGVRIHRLNVPRSNQPSTAKRLLAGCVFAGAGLLRLFNARQYDALLVGTNPPAAPMIGQWLTKRYGIPYAYLIHDLYPDIAVSMGVLGEGSRIARSAHHWQRGWLHDARQVYVLGRCMRDHLVRAYDLPAERIEVLPNWADADAVPVLPTASRFRARHSLSGFLVLYGGNIGHSQGLGSVLDAAKLTAATHPDITYVIVGGGEAKAVLEARVQAEGLANVRLFPAVPPEEYPDLLATADVALVSLDPKLAGLAVPSKFYSLLASGRPVIGLVAADSEIARVLAEHDCGVRVAEGNAADLAAAAVRLRDDGALAAAMGARARQALEAYFTLPAIAERYNACLRTMVE